MTPTPPLRTDVLSMLWKRAQWLDGLIEDIEHDKVRITDKLKVEIYVNQVLSQNCKALLYGLKDEELEIRLRDLEEKLATGVLIPVDKEKKKL